MCEKILTRKQKAGAAMLLSALMLGSIFLFSENAYSASANLAINEIAAAEPSNHEWIEIVNKSNEPVSLENWKFWEAETNHGLNLIQGDDYILEPGEYAIITQNDANFIADYPNVNAAIFDSSWGTLNEGGEEIGLKNAEGEFVELFTYVSAVDYSLERKDVNSPDYTEYNWVEHPSDNSAGAKNYWAVDNGEPDPEPKNQAPTAIISATSTAITGETVLFDGNDSSDPDGSIVEFSWTINNTTLSAETSFEYTFSASGTYQVILTVTDDAGDADNANLEITIADPIEEEPDNETGEITATTTSAIIINEFVSDAASEQNEWIELYNNSSSTIDLTGYILHDGNSQIAAPTSTVQAEGFVVITLTSSKLNNSGDIIILKNPAGLITDQVSYGNWDDGNPADNAPTVEDPNSLARITDTNTFAETTTPTPGEINIITAPAGDPPPPTSTGGGGGAQPFIPTANYYPSDIIINELVSDPSDGEEEFVELFNNTKNIIDLSGWWLEDGSETKTTLSGNISASGFLVIEKPRGNLNNSGDVVILFAPNGIEVDAVTYGTWDDGNLADNAPVPEDPMSLIRKIDGQDANNDYYDFVLTATITKGAKNTITSVTETGEVIKQEVGSSDILLNEILPNPEGSDGEEEFIELFNAGNETVDLAGWKLGDASSKRYEITQGSLKPNGFIIFKRSMTDIALNNTGGDEVSLYGATGTLFDQIKYVGSAAENESYARKEDNSWVWTTKLTPGIKNIIEGKSSAPAIFIEADTEAMVGEMIVFDASDTTDPDNDKINFVWDFADGENAKGSAVKHAFKKIGVYTVRLVATDSAGNKSEKSIIITVGDKNNQNNAVSFGAIEKIKISEFVANPEGSDDAEFIELFNPTAEEIDLSGIKLDDEEGGSRPYTIPAETIILPGEYKIFGRQDTKLALNNTGDSVRILYFDGTILTEIRYDDVIEGSSYIQDEEENWVWTSSLTPGEPNILSAPQAVAGVKLTRGKSKNIKPILNTTLEGVRDADIGDMVTLAGTVAVEPGVLGTQYFYIVGSPGVQIYSYKKEFPELAVGDKIQVTGEISNSGGNTRIKLSQAEDIKKIDYIGAPEPQTTEVAEVNEPLEGSLITVNGEITELKTSYMYVDDGTDEIKVYFKSGAGINKKILKPGMIVSVTGIVQQTKDGYQILPRSQEDIVKTGVVEDAVTKIENETATNQREVAEKYLTATAGGLTAIIIGLFLQARGGTLLAWVKKMMGKVLKTKK